MGRIRIDGGFLKGRYIYFPDTKGLRPLTSYIKKAIFDILGDITDTCVLDAFCGSGVFGIEAISRGARSVDFVEKARNLCSSLRRNLVALGIEDRCNLICLCAEEFFHKNTKVYDLVFVDPPFSYVLTKEFLNAVSRSYRTLVLRRHKLTSLSEKALITSVLGQPTDERFYSDSVVYFFRSSFSRK